MKFFKQPEIDRLKQEVQQAKIDRVAVKWPEMPIKTDNDEYYTTKIKADSTVVRELNKDKFRVDFPGYFKDLEAARALAIEKEKLYHSKYDELQALRKRRARFNGYQATNRNQPLEQVVKKADYDEAMEFLETLGPKQYETVRTSFKGVNSCDYIRCVLELKKRI